MLLTDIEGSTRMAREAGDEWPAVLGHHDAILDAAIAAEAGEVSNTTGDGLFAVFDDTHAAVRAAVAAQRALRDHSIRARMGIHRGRLQRGAAGYLGIEIHRLARVMAAGHGGQVLLSAAARDGLDGVELEDLGLHRLKDFPEPERVFHLVIDGSRPADFPPLKTRSVRPTNLPVLETPLVGRTDELAALRLLLTERARLVTLTGQGGSGKTRLALAVAVDLLDGFAGGAWFVPLADHVDAAQLLPTVAEKLRVADEAARPLLVTLADRFEQELTLLVLDNLEQLRGAPAVVRDLLAAAPSLRVLATSQAPLRIAAEHVMALGPLPPGDAQRLFVERATARRAGFDASDSMAAITAICKRLDGLPLAIELAAARTAALSPENLLDRLDGAMTVLKGRDHDRPERHRSLQAAIEWSHGLLGPRQQMLFAWLTAFATSFTLADAEALLHDDIIDEVEELVEAPPSCAASTTTPAIRASLSLRHCAISDTAALSRPAPSTTRALPTHAGPWSWRSMLGPGGSRQPRPAPRRCSTGSTTRSPRWPGHASATR